MQTPIPSQILEHILDSDLASRERCILPSERAFVASGAELSYQSLDVQGNARIDGKVVVGLFQSSGTTEINGILEVDPILE